VGEALNALRGECPWLSVDDDGSLNRPRIFHSLYEPLWPQVFGAASGRPTRTAVLSPYFDAKPDILGHHVPGLAGAPVTIYSQKGPRSLSPAWQAHANAHPSVALYFTDYGEANKPRVLHAKAVVVATPDESLLAFGSANFTRAGWCSHRGTGNVETVLRVRGLPPEFDAVGLFDPRGARRSPRPDEFVGQSSPTVHAPPPELRLLDAWLDDQALALAVDPPDAAILRWEAEISTKSGDPMRIALGCEAHDRLTARLDAATVARCARGATTVRVRATPAAGVALSSNLVFLVQLEDPIIGRAARIERRIRDAQQDSQQFAAVLDELTASGEDEALRRFFLSCDLRLGDAGRSGFLARLPTIGDDAGRRLDAAVSMNYGAHHDPAQEFVETHLKRLRRHAQAPTVAAAPRFMTIAHNVAIVQSWQFAGMLASFEAKPLRRPAEQWKRDRTHLNAVLEHFGALLALVARTYLAKLGRSRELEENLEWTGGLAGLQVRAAEFLQARDRFAALSVQVHTPAGRRPVPFFATDLLEDGEWRAWTREVTGDARRLV
jgi:hypothetical protein